VFVRVSGFTADELIGSPHNIIRHPEMPRAAFKLVWDYLLSGKPVAAYVKNMAADGRYYWVMAMIAPIADGFLSIRFLPTSALRADVEGVYRELRAIEMAEEGRGRDPKAGMLAASQRLGEILATRGHASYDSFMRAAVHHELKARRDTLRREGARVLGDLAPSVGKERAEAQEVRALYRTGQELHFRATAFETVLDESTQFIADLDKRASAILELCTDFRYIAFNITVKAARLGATGAVLGVISSRLAEASARVTGIVSGLKGQVTAVTEQLQQVLFQMEWTGLQLEMVVAYHGEMQGVLASGSTAGRGDEWDRQCHDLERRQAAFHESCRATIDGLQAFGAQLYDLASDAEALHKAMLTIQMTHVTGLIEAPHLNDGGECSSIFAEVRRQIDGIKGDLDAFRAALKELSAVARQTPAMATAYGEAVDLLRHASERLAALRPRDETAGAYAAYSAPAFDDATGYDALPAGGEVLYNN
jgi:aerotaxis receptor